MNKKYKFLLILCFSTVFLFHSSSSSEAFFGLTACEKVKKQAMSDQAIVRSLANRQASLIKTRDEQLKREGHNWFTGPNSGSDDAVKATTLAAYKKILSSLINLKNNQPCLKPEKYAEVLSYIEAYRKVVAFWSGPNAPFLSKNLVQVGDFAYYLK